MICWGGLTSLQTRITDLDEAGNVTLEVDMDGVSWSYRALRYLWRTTLFSTSSELLEFGVVEPGSEMSQVLTVQNNSADDLEIDCILFTDPVSP